MSAGVEVRTEGMPNLDKVLRRAGFFKWRAALKQIGGIIETQTVERIAKDKESPEGHAWEPLSPEYRRWKRTRSGGGTLEFRGHLRESIQFSIVGETLEVGSNLKYAATHQYGDDRLAWGKFQAHYQARPFLGLSSADEDEVELAMAQYVDAVLEGRR